MISNDKWPSQIPGNYNLTTSTIYRTKLLHEYTIYHHVPSRPWILIYTTVPYLSVNTYTNVPATYTKEANLSQKRNMVPRQKKWLTNDNASHPPQTMERSTTYDGEESP